MVCKADSDPVLSESPVERIFGGRREVGEEGYVGGERGEEGGGDWLEAGVFEGAGNG